MLGIMHTILENEQEKLTGPLVANSTFDHGAAGASHVGHSQPIMPMLEDRKQGAIVMAIAHSANKGRSPRKTTLNKNTTNAFAEQFFEKFKIRLH